MSGSRIKTKTGSCATSASASSRARPSPWSATPAPARPRSPVCSCAFTISSAGPSKSAASTFASSISTPCGAISAVVLQDPYLFTGTHRFQHPPGHGIDRAGAPWKRPSAQVNLLEFVDSLPEGFAQPVRERGNGFSTGQKQLISFARALAHHPRFLILDEATSSVDTETEFRVRDALATHGGRPHFAGDRPSPVHHPARRPYFRHA